jgi:isoleucyl-tRNA synthetase
MDLVLKIVVLGRAARNSANIKNRQPIGKMYVKAEFELPEFYKEIIEDELNIKEIEFKDDVSDFSSYSFKPQLKVLGPKYGKQLGQIRNALANLDGNAAKSDLDTKGILTISLEDGNIDLTAEDLLIDVKQMEGYETVTDNGITVVIDTNLSEELLREGFVREIISKIQTMRKEAGFDVTDHICLYQKGNDNIKAIMTEHMDEVKDEVLADSIELDTLDGYTKEWNINGEQVTLGVKKAN